MQLSRIARLYQDMTLFLENVAPDGAYVAVVLFNERAHTTKELIKLTSATIADVISSLPTTPGGDTCIGCGLLEGLKVPTCLQMLCQFVKSVCSLLTVCVD